MASFSWYWHRLRAMRPGEVLGHLRRKVYQWTDLRRGSGWGVGAVAVGSTFPRLPDPARAPEGLRESLRRDAALIMEGRWQAFGHVNLQVDTPPRWHREYLAGRDIPEDRSSFQLDHRALPGGADIKLIWELSRWYQLGRLAMAAYLVDDYLAGRRCLEWLEDWVKHNPPYRGWNWTSALESGMRLIQFTWIDALLRSCPRAGEYEAALARLRSTILPAHLWFTWRYRSFGSSANNHLLGELAGLISALVRWPDLARWGAPLEALQRMWEQEVLAQFAEDGGNREQALHYHLFSFEFCWQTLLALRAAQRDVAPAVEERLARAAEFFLSVQVESDAWDYGDSDDAYVTWFFEKASTALAEWHGWLKGHSSDTALGYWLGPPPRSTKEGGSATAARDWLLFRESGMAICRAQDWVIRWDLSPLGYLSTAAHGHLDALHLSLWYKGVAFLIDPGTGAYYSDKMVRVALASWSAHNGPHLVGLDYPRRGGTFLWKEHHGRPEVTQVSDHGMVGCLTLPPGKVRRVVTRLSEMSGWQVEDQYLPDASDSGWEFMVCWQCAPGTELSLSGERRYRLKREGLSLEVIVSEDWHSVELARPDEGRPDQVGESVVGGLCSPAYRQTMVGPQLRLRARRHNTCLFRTTFLASADS